MFNVVLVEPEIPPNTGNVGRLCLATGSTLHLVQPLGFSLDAKQLRRAGLDYWKDVDLKIWPSLESLGREAGWQKEGGGRPAPFHLLTTKTEQAYWSAEFQRGDYLVFGSETRGLPGSLLRANPGRCLTIPMVTGATRSLNLATAAGIVLYEAMRQVSGECGKVGGDAP
jgi:tRNA (cytidine/uridine-2'-O-)-methyltransferase